MMRLIQIGFIKFNNYYFFFLTKIKQKLNSICLLKVGVPTNFRQWRFRKSLRVGQTKKI